MTSGKLQVWHTRSAKCWSALLASEATKQVSLAKCHSKIPINAPDPNSSLLFRARKVLLKGDSSQTLLSSKVGPRERIKEKDRYKGELFNLKRVHYFNFEVKERLAKCIRDQEGCMYVFRRWVRRYTEVRCKGLRLYNKDMWEARW